MKIKRNIKNIHVVSIPLHAIAMRHLLRLEIVTDENEYTWLHDYHVHYQHKNTWGAVDYQSCKTIMAIILPQHNSGHIIVSWCLPFLTTMTAPFPSG